VPAAATWWCASGAQFMREGDWIAMPGVPLITAGHTEAATDVEKDRACA
jgi:hypothetical protein